VRRRAKYSLQHLVRVNLAGQDRAYRCVYQLEDENGEQRCYFCVTKLLQSYVTMLYHGDTCGQAKVGRQSGRTQPHVPFPAVNNASTAVQRGCILLCNMLLLCYFLQVTWGCASARS
jgi:hypothetical protein